LGLDEASTPNVALSLWNDLLPHLPAGISLDRLELAEMDENAAVVTRRGRRQIARGGFSAAHRTYAPQLSPQENQRLYGICSSPAGHGHNYQVEVALPPEASADADLWRDLDHRNLSTDLPGLRGVNVVTEAIAALIARRNPLVDWVRVWETPDFYAQYLPGEDAYRLGRRYRFHAAHRLHSPALSPEENQHIYSKCNRPDPHGHTYVVQVEVQGRLDPLTGTAYDLACLDQAAQDVLAPLDYTYLDQDIPAFASQPTTGENIAAYLFTQFQRRLGGSLESIHLSETANNRFAAALQELA
jgi:6-pyruvoyltetrahydropterin/6-carboxytetrahydropterin synthase